MRVTTRQINEWAATVEAHSLLPMLVRRLIHASGANPSSIDMPAGESTNQPGWDGAVYSNSENPWVPLGQSYWELSCEGKDAGQVTRKANADYRKRTSETPKDSRIEATYVAVSARRWSTKRRWGGDSVERGEWGGVRAFDADDLEQWLEQTPAVALWFAEILGLSGPGVVSPQDYWSTWANQSDPVITPAAFFVDREVSRDDVAAQVKKRQDQVGPVRVKADSVEEATAFACAVVNADPKLSAETIVVTEKHGWNYVRANQEIRIVISGRPEYAEQPVLRPGLTLVIPHATGDTLGVFRGEAGKEMLEIEIQRPLRYEFEKALVSMGLDYSSAERLAVNTGRSWSVLRRCRAINPAICRPPWLTAQESKALSTICLIGLWSGSNSADREAVAFIAGCPYESVERNLRSLAKYDDAPVIEIGTAWKAKSPIELLNFFEARLTQGELDRYFDTIRQILGASDPVLELPERDRCLSTLYGKTRPQSSLLIDSLCDTLVKLAVRSEESPKGALASLNIKGRTRQLVKDLLLNANSERWLSLSSYMRSLAEASPETFLSAIEHSLNESEPPVHRLFAESSEIGLMGRCWHAELLWALEILAWSPDYLFRVASIFARLTRAPAGGNWANKPIESLLNVFRSWFPQTAAGVDQRIQALDILITKEPEVSFSLLNSIVYVGDDTASPSQHPAWRKYDRGAGRGVSHSEMATVYCAAADRLISISRDNANRLAHLIEKLVHLDPERRQAVLELLTRFTDGSPTDEEKELLRSAAISHLHWLQIRDDWPEEYKPGMLDFLNVLQLKLTPDDPIVRHRWLFATRWPNLPSGVGRISFDEYRTEVAAERDRALEEILNRYSMTGVERLASQCADGTFLGETLARARLSTCALARWIADKGGDFTSKEPLTTVIRAVLRSLARQRSSSVLDELTSIGKRRNWEQKHYARLLTLAREESATWVLASSLGASVRATYWAEVQPFIPQRDDVETVLRNMLDADRPRSAFFACHIDLEQIAPELLAEMLERYLSGHEPDRPEPDASSIVKAIEHLEASELSKQRLLRIEFHALPKIEFYRRHCPLPTLYGTLASNPSVFVEFLCLCYKSDHDECSVMDSKESKYLAKVAQIALAGLRRIPGVEADNQTDPDALRGFIDEARRLSQEKGRLSVCDQKLGEILAHAPPDQDGTWPCSSVRNILDEPEMDEMRQGFISGVYNKRGVFSKAYNEGGDQERELSDKYRAFGRALLATHQNVATMLMKLAQAYDVEATAEDDSARLRIER